jgi:adenylate kinase family enzyme
MIVIFYGEMGSGKSYQAQSYAKRFDLPFFEGDDVVTPEMRKCVLVRPIPKKVLEDFIFNCFVPEVINRANENKGELVVAQALYSREHRRLVKDKIEEAGLKVSFFCVNVPYSQNVRQLLTRPLGPAWVYYWLLSHFFFQRGGDDDA